MHPNRDRADRILDAAGALLLRLGYRKVSVDDVARSAGIGKGTVYLHWRTKEVLFHALLLRELAELTEELLDWVRADPAEILPHRMIRASFLLTCRRPLLMALLTGNAELLGTMGDRSLKDRQEQVAGRFREVMHERGLVRDDVPNLDFALRTSALGFYIIDGFTDGFAEVGLEARADALAHTIRAAFEPPGEPDPAAVSATAAELTWALEDLVSGYRKGIYTHDPG